MGILDRLLAPFGYAKASKPAPTMLLALGDSQRWEVPQADQAEKQARLYAALTWIATAIDRTAEVAAGGIFSVKRRAQGPDGDDEDIPNHPFELLLERPNPAQSRGEFLRDAFSFFKLTGNLYLYQNAAREDLPPDELWIVPSQLMKPLPDGQSYIKGYEFTPPGQQKIFVPRWQIIHLKTFNPLSPFVGLSAVQSLALDAYGDIAQQKWNLALFDKNNGKFPGILAFKHLIDDPQWSKILKQRDTEWGGANRPGVMMLRGVGDTIQWLPAAMSQKEMEFIGGRTFAKEEIYGKLAPGLSSILAVNATEANAIAGKSTLIEFGVFPLLEQFGQKITAEVLPLYGENLVGAFDDIRISNRNLDLQEQTEFAKYHTVNEVRAEYYDEEPLYLDESPVKALDEDARQAEERKQTALEQFKPAAVPAKAHEGQLDPRGLMFVAQIGPSTPLPGDATKQPAPPMVPPPQQQPGAEQVQQEEPDEQEGEAEMKAWEKFAVR